MTPRKIGILGGMGPEATVLLMQRLITATPANNDHDHIPMIVDNNPQVPSRIDTLIHGTGEDPGRVLAQMAYDLQRAGAEALIMPCNTAHHYANDILLKIDIPFFNMVDLTCTKLSSLLGKNGHVGILASPAVRMTQLFEQPLAEVGLSPIYLEDDAVLLQIIKKIKAGDISSEVYSRLDLAANQLKNAGANALIVACTEFSLICDKINTDIPILDTLDVLVEATVSFSLADRQP